MAITNKPTIFIVHGAWHRPEHMEPIITPLKALGFPVVCYKSLSSVDAAEDELIAGSRTTIVTLADDVGALKPHLVRLIEEEKEIFIVAHSYGGDVTSEMVTQDVTLGARRAKGLSGGVFGLLYMAAFLLLEGVKIGDYGETFTDPSMEFRVFNAKTGLVDAVNAERTFYNDLTESEQKKWHAMLLPFAPDTHVPLTNAGTRYAPTTYAKCLKDNVFRVEIQEKMIRQMREAGVDVREMTLDASHSPFLSMPTRVVDEVQAAIGWSKGKLALPS